MKALHMPLHSSDDGLWAFSSCDDAVQLLNGAARFPGCGRQHHSLDCQFGCVTDDGIYIINVDLALAARIQHELLELATGEGTVGAQPSKKCLAGITCDGDTSLLQSFADDRIQRAALVCKTSDCCCVGGFLEQHAERIVRAEIACLDYQGSRKGTFLQQGLEHLRSHP